MKWKEDKNARGFYNSRSGGFEFTITNNGGRYYIVASHSKKDIRFYTWYVHQFGCIGNEKSITG